MTLKTYELPYGDTVKTVTLPEDEVIAEVRTKSFTPIPKEEVKAKILEAIRNPIGIGPLDERVKPGDTVCFICNDLTRVANSFDFMPVFLDELNRLGVPDDHMKIVFSLGAHRKMTREEMAEAVGEEVASRVPMFNSDCYADQNFEYFGQTSRGTPVLINKLLCNVDHVILTGTIVFHYFAGFGGGRKAILPGCAAMETIRMNHQWMMDDRVGLGITTGNPCYEDQVEGVERFAKDRDLFLFNAVLNAKHEFLRMYAGHWVKAHLEACKFVREVYGVPIPREADLVIVSCGGYPKDINAYQMQKTMDIARIAVKKGGAVILVAECREGSGNQKFEDTCRRLGSYEAIVKELKEHFVMGANKASAVTRNMQKAPYFLVSALDPKLAKELMFAGCVTSIEEALALVRPIVGEHPSVILMPEGSLTVPLLPED